MSGEKTGPAEENGPIPDQHDIMSLRTAQDEARDVLDHQIQNFTDVDNKAARTFRLDAILLGLLLTAVSFIMRSEAMSIEPYVNPLTVFSVIALIGSFIAAVITYTTTGIQTGLGPDDIERLVKKRYTEMEWLILMLRSEAEWMRENERQNRIGVRFLWISHGALILGILAAFIGIAVVHIEV